jgi:hypothetical protein
MERNSRQNSALTERGSHRTLRGIAKKNHKMGTTYPHEDPFHTKSNMSFTNLPCTIGHQLLNLLLLKVMLRCINYSVTTIKPGHQTNGHEQNSQMSYPLCSFLHQEEFAFVKCCCEWRGSVINKTWIQDWLMDLFS